MQHHRKLLSVLVLATWSALCVCVGDTPDEKNQRSTGELALDPQKKFHRRLWECKARNPPLLNVSVLQNVDVDVIKPV